MTTSLKTWFAAAVALSFTACSTDTTKTTNADGTTSTTTEVTTPNIDEAGAKMGAAAERVGEKANAAGEKIGTKLDEAGAKLGAKMDAMGDAAAKSAHQTKANMKAATHK